MTSVVPSLILVKQIIGIPVLAAWIAQVNGVFGNLSTSFFFRFVMNNSTVRTTTNINSWITKITFRKLCQSSNWQSPFVGCEIIICKKRLVDIPPKLLEFIRSSNFSDFASFLAKSIHVKCTTTPPIPFLTKQNTGSMQQRHVYELL